MAMNRFQVEYALLSPTRLRGVMRELGLSDPADPTSPVADPDAPNADLNEAIASALESIGVVPADRSAVVDSDLARVSDASAGRFIDLAEIRALEGFVVWLAARPRAERTPDWSIDRVGASGEWVLSILKQKQDRYDSIWKGGGPEAAKMDRGIRHVLKTHRHRPANSDFPLFD
jgi:hypothetical protein